MKRLVLAGVAAAVLAAPAGATIRPVDRAAIDRTIDAFVRTAVRREHAGQAYDLVTPSLRSGISRRAWARGSVPVYPFDARGTTFHGWTVDDATPTRVDFELLLHPRNRKDSDITYAGTVVKMHGRWLIDSMNPLATFGGNQVVGPHDFVPQSGGGGQRPLSQAWLALPAALLGLIVLVPLSVLVAHWVRDRRAERAIAVPDRSSDLYERLRARKSQNPS